MGVPGGANLLLAGGGAAYQINQSLRFNSADSAYLNRTPASSGSTTTWTISCWVKRAALGSAQMIWSAGTSAITTLSFQSDDTIRLRNSTVEYITNWKFRDPSAWYHILLKWDTTNGTQADRAILYVNGRALGTGDYSLYDKATSSEASTWNTNVAHNLGRYAFNGTSYLSGYLAEVNFIDGTALTPSSFGETDTITGAWIPKKYSGSFGTNGFYLKFESSGIGTDSSGNGNTWTANNFSTSGTGTDVMSDTPTNNYATLNATVGTTSNGSATLSDGNLICSVPRLCSIDSTFGVTSGKYYWEVTATDLTNSPYGMGIFATGYGIHHGSTNYLILTNTGSLYTPGDSDNKGNGWGPTYNGSTDVIGLALDMNNYTLGFNKNGGSFTTYDFSAYISSYKMADVTPCWKAGGNLGSSGATFNFGQRAFAYTPPTGFKALNTANLPEPTIKKGSKYFNTVLWTGNGANPRSITGVGFSPDFVWTKKRNTAQDHFLYDAVRGSTNGNFYELRSSSTSAEGVPGTANVGMRSLDSDGFTIGSDASVNTNNDTYVGWCWDANGAGSSNTAGSITSTVSANATAGFSIVTYTGAGSAGTVGHGLGVAPSMVITKDRGATYDWYVYHIGLSSGYYVRLNDTLAQAYEPSLYSSAPTSTVINYGSSTGVMRSGANYVAYCFSEVAGYSRIATYVGNGSSDGPFVFCGFRPAFLLRRAAINAADDWVMQDLRRPGYNETKDHLTSNQAYAEVTNSTETGVDILSNGFKVRSSNYKTNYNGATYIFAAFAEHPFKYANAR